MAYTPSQKALRKANGYGYQGTGSADPLYYIALYLSSRSHLSNRVDGILACFFCLIQGRIGKPQKLFGRKEGFACHVGDPHTYGKFDRLASLLECSVFDQFLICIS